MLNSDGFVYRSSYDQTITTNMTDRPLFFDSMNMPVVNHSSDLNVANVINCANTFNNNFVLINNSYFPSSSTNFENYNPWATNLPISNSSSNQNFSAICTNEPIDLNFENKENKPLIPSTSFITPIEKDKNVLSPINKLTSSTSKKFNSKFEEIRYRQRRQKNNEAAKQSRSKRRDRENYLKTKADALEIENKMLRTQINLLRAQLSKGKT